MLCQFLQLQLCDSTGKWSLFCLTAHHVILTATVERAQIRRGLIGKSLHVVTLHAACKRCSPHRGLLIEAIVVGKALHVVALNTALYDISRSNKTG